MLLQDRNELISPYIAGILGSLGFGKLALSGPLSQLVDSLLKVRVDANLWISSRRISTSSLSPRHRISALFLPFTLALGYKDAIHCHCILFDASEKVSKDWAGKTAQEEFDKAKTALANGKLKLAAFYAGATAHYVGDLSQFMHIMGAEAHWGSEDQTLHHRYEEVADRDLNPSRSNFAHLRIIHRQEIGRWDHRSRHCNQGSEVR